MITRYCGQLKIDLTFLDVKDGRLRFGGVITMPEGYTWCFDNVLVNRSPLDWVAFDIAAAGAVHYGSLYGPGYDPETEGGEIPDWAPRPEVASKINDALLVADQGYCIRREVDGPTTYSG